MSQSNSIQSWISDRVILFRLRFAVTQVRRKNKDAPNLGHPDVVTTTNAQRPSSIQSRMSSFFKKLLERVRKLRRRSQEKLLRSEIAGMQLVR